jgi:membrane associated rhomboid family serine protease
VLPVSDVNPMRHRRGWVTGLLIAVNVVVFLALQPRGGCEEAAFLFRFAAIPAELVGLEQLSTGTASEVIGQCASRIGEKSVLLSVVTAMFLHGSFGHLFGNMLYLLVFGNNVEDRLGHLRFLGFYLGGGAVATLVFTVLNLGSTVPLLGASGAVAAVLGAYLLLYPRARVNALAPFPLYLASILPGIGMRAWFLVAAIITVPAWLLLGGWFLLQVVASAEPSVESGVAYSAHVGGFVAGIVLLLVLDGRRRRRGAPQFHPPRRAA